MKGTARLVLAATLLIGATAVDAQQRLTLHFRDARVTLDVQNVPVQQILAEWTRIGGTRIINGEKVGGAAISLQLTDVPERQALDILLRSVSGYMLAMRQPGAAGVSSVDRVLILPTSVTPRDPPAAAQARPAAARRMPMQPFPAPPVSSGFVAGANDDDLTLEPSELSVENPVGAQRSIPGGGIGGNGPSIGGFPQTVPAAQTDFESPASIGPGIAPPETQLPGNLTIVGQPKTVAPGPAGLAAPVMPPNTKTPPAGPFGAPRGSLAPGVISPVPPARPPATTGPTIPPQAEQTPGRGSSQ